MRCATPSSTGSQTSSVPLQAPIGTTSAPQYSSRVDDAKPTIEVDAPELVLIVKHLAAHPADGKVRLATAQGVLEASWMSNGEPIRPGVPHRFTS